MNRNKDKMTPAKPLKSQATKPRHPIHPCFTSNSAEETLRRMQGLPERIAKFKEKLDADRKSNAGWNPPSRRSDISAYQTALDWLAQEFAISRGGTTTTTPFAGLFASAGHGELIHDAVKILFCDFELNLDKSEHRSELVEYLETTKSFLMEMLEEEEIWIVFYPISRVL